MPIFHQTDEELTAVSLRAPKSLMARLKDSAKKADISLNTAIVQCIEHALNQEQEEAALLGGRRAKK